MPDWSLLRQFPDLFNNALNEYKNQRRTMYADIARFNPHEDEVWDV